MAKRELVHISADTASMEGMLEVPNAPIGVVLFAHGSGSSRLSPRNNYVAGILRESRIGTLLLDLLTPVEDRTYENRFDITLLTDRLGTAAAWLRHHADTSNLQLGLFGASTGAAAALQLAAQPNAGIAAVVSRGGRPDLAGRAALAVVTAPTLLIVGGADDVVIGLNRTACNEMHCDKELVIVPGATHLFEEPGTLEEVARLASSWFVRHFAGT
jgi:pimeloyl-ACP methyl ester carboxylesterase